MLPYPIRVEYWNKLWSYLSSLKGSKGLTFKLSGSAAGLFGDSFPFLGGITEYQVRVFLLLDLGSRLKTWKSIGDYTLVTVLNNYRDFMLMDLDVTVQYVVIIGLDVDHGVWTGKDSESGFGCTRLICASFGSTRLMCASFGSTRLIRASFGSTRLIRASFGSTRLMCASFGSTRLICASFGSTGLICASFGSTRLICAFYGTTRLLCRVRAQRGADRREAGRTREGHMDASGFLIASAMYFVRIFGL
ncbi:NAC-alpha domain-containing protein 1 [Cucumis melo var. makuwa]|uniref:NAC-alpha domain-containing protein 1 n=1 Tax=Cucumis melo var. makuwa TaxID=1194695 RepID=A0A5A7SS29_CUCMM|nr:NAC-alpha domain-containing protein 1 [Cucumis melo var. makuwa]